MVMVTNVIWIKAVKRLSIQTTYLSVFSIDGSNDERLLCSLSNAGENRTFYFVIILFSY